MFGKLLLYVLLNSFSAYGNEHTPVVLWHGMGDTCCYDESLGGIAVMIDYYLPGIYINSLEIGDGDFEETKNGFLMNANQQVEIACELIASDPKLQNGYNAIGFSQGAQFLRAVAQRCPTPRMKNLISLGGQHQGIYGLPDCAYHQHFYCNILRLILSKAAYWGWVQRLLVQAQYWHDPIHEEVYRTGSTFIAEINNEHVLNTVYRDNLKKLEKLVLVKFSGDTMVDPVETEWFGFYTPGQGVEITNLQDSALFKEDRLGLKELYESDRLDFISLPGDHLEFSQEWFADTIIRKYLS